jgi:hypothetical protein
MSVAGEHSLLRVVYGQPRIGAQIANVLSYNGEWVFQLVWAWGPCHSVNDFWYDGLEASLTWTLPSWMTATHYTGTGNTLNAKLVAAFAAGGAGSPITYTDTLPNICYTVVSAAQNSLNDGIGFSARIKGRSCFDPRMNGGAGGTAWTRTPALHIADFIRSDVYGLGEEVDDTSLAEAANWNETLINGKQRNTMSLVLNSQKDGRDWIEVMREYADCRVFKSGGSYKIVADKPRSSVYTLSHANNRIKDVPSIYKRGTANSPTIVIATYTNASLTPNTEERVSAALAGVEAGTTPYRESFVSLPGIDDRDEAYRHAESRLNRANVSDMAMTVLAFDEGLQLEAGDVTTVDYPPFGISSKLMQVAATPESAEPGRWTLLLSEYDAAIFSSDVAPPSGLPDTELPTPSEPPSVTGVDVTEGFARNADGTYSSRVTATWTASSWPYVAHYLVTVRQNSAVIRTDIVSRGVNTYVTPPVPDGVSIQVDVQIVSNVSAVSAIGVGSSDVTTINGKTTPPTDVTNLYGFEAGGKVFLYWQAALDLDIWRYEIRYGTTGQTWDQATLLDRVDGLTYIAEGLPAGTHRIHVKALDSQGNYSVNSDYADIIVSLDAGAFAAESRVLAGDLGHADTDYISSYVIACATVYITDFGDSVSYGHVGYPLHTGTFTDNSLGNTPFAHPHTAGTSVLVSEQWDYGVTVTGNVGIVCEYTDLSGTATLIVQTKVNSGDAWTSHSSASTSTTFRYVRAKISTTGTMRVTSMTGKVTVVPKKEMGVLTSTNATPGVATTVSLGGKYAKYTSVQLTAKNTSGNKYFCIYDNVVLSLTGANSFDVFVFDHAGTQVNSALSWTFEGL